VTIEDRLRATTEAVTASMHPVRPLDLHPDEAGARQPAGHRRARPPRRRPGWLVPLTAATTVVAVAATLILVRSLSATDSGSHPAPAATSTSVVSPSTGVPQYYVQINNVSGASIPGVPTGAALVGDTSTGKRVRVIMPWYGGAFSGSALAGSSDDRTFVLEAVPVTSNSQTVQSKDSWIVLHLTPGAAQPVRLTPLPITSSLVGDYLEGLAVSPDGSTLAVLFQPAEDGVVNHGLAPVDSATLRTYSLATGRVLHTWTGSGSPSTMNSFADLSWLDDGHTLAFYYPSTAAHRYVRTLNTADPGTSLFSDSRTVFSVPAGRTCDSTLLMTADGKSVICGNFAPDSRSCATGQLAFTAYSVATGKLDRVLYSYTGGCDFADAVVMWAPSTALVIGWILVSKPVTPPPPTTNEIGVVAQGKFTALPSIKLGTGGDEAPSMIAF